MSKTTTCKKKTTTVHSLGGTDGDVINPLLDEETEAEAVPGVT